jgi:hypothetical protein
MVRNIFFGNGGTIAYLTCQGHTGSLFTREHGQILVACTMYN